jgi:hypothetical protein
MRRDAVVSRRKKTVRKIGTVSAFGRRIARIDASIATVAAKATFQSTIGKLPNLRT